MLQQVKMEVHISQYVVFDSYLKCTFFVFKGIEEDFTAWKSKMLEFLTEGIGTEGHKRCACGKDDVTTGNCCQSQNGSPADLEHPPSIDEDTEVNFYYVYLNNTI